LSHQFGETALLHLLYWLYGGVNVCTRVI